MVIAHNSMVSELLLYYDTHSAVCNSTCSDRNKFSRYYESMWFSIHEMWKTRLGYTHIHWICYCTSALGTLLYKKERNHAEHELQHCGFFSINDLWNRQKLADMVWEHCAFSVARISVWFQVGRW